MKKPIIIELVIWLFILVVTSTAIFYTYQNVFVSPNVYVIHFEDIDGITKGSPVRFMGINVGYVRKLKSKDEHIDVQIIITKKDMEIPNGTMARVEFYGLGGSKSIELMPPDSSCDVGILTGETIRLADVAHETKGLVEIIEMVEKYVKNLNKTGMDEFLHEMSHLKDDKIKNMGDEFTNIETDISDKLNTIKLKQDDYILKIEKMNDNVEKINEFIKK